MREILFRGKRIDNGEWVEGSLITDVFYRVGEGNKNSIPYILSVSGIDYDSWEDLDDDYGLYEVDPDTVGQCTGLTDKNGKKIFEGDIVKVKGLYPDRRGEQQIWRRFRTGDIFYYKASFYFDKWALSTASENLIEVIGNIHDNPELIEADV